MADSLDGAYFDNYSSIDQSDRRVPVNLRHTVDGPVELLVSTRARKSPFWHLARRAGCWRAEVFNRMYLPRGYARLGFDGWLDEYSALSEKVSLWDVSAARQIRVTGADAAAFVNYVVTRDLSMMPTHKARYVVLCDESGRIVNDPLLLKFSENEFWFSISDSDLILWLRGVRVGTDFDVEIDELDVSPLQMQGPQAHQLMTDLTGRAVDAMPSFGLIDAKIDGLSVVVSRTGFSGQAGYEIYLRSSTVSAEKLWSAIFEAGSRYGLTLIPPTQSHRIISGILAWGQDVDNEMVPFQVGLASHVPTDKSSPYVGKAALERIRDRVDNNDAPFALTMVGLKFSGEPVVDHLQNNLLIYPATSQDAPIGYLTSAWWAPQLGTNVALGRVPPPFCALKTELLVRFGPGTDMRPAVVSAFPIS